MFLAPYLSIGLCIVRTRSITKQVSRFVGKNDETAAKKNHEYCKVFIAFKRYGSVVFLYTVAANMVSPFNGHKYQVLKAMQSKNA